MVDDADDVYTCARQLDGWWYGAHSLLPVQVRFRMTGESILYEVCGDADGDWDVVPSSCHLQTGDRR